MSSSNPPVSHQRVFLVPTHVLFVRLNPKYMILEKPDVFLFSRVFEDPGDPLELRPFNILTMWVVVAYNNNNKTTTTVTTTTTTTTTTPLTTTTATTIILITSSSTTTTTTTITTTTTTTLTTNQHWLATKPVATVKCKVCSTLCIYSRKRL